MRAFIAWELPLSLKSKLEKTLEEFKRLPLEAKWTEPKNLHLTLKFLGEIEEKKIEEIKKILVDISQEFKSLIVNLVGFGFFPNEKYARVFFVATDKEEPLAKIAQRLEEKLQILGFAKENRFKSHITLCRLRSSKNINLLQEKIKKLSLKEAFILKNICLFKSALAPSGPIYEEIFKISLSA